MTPPTTQPAAVDVLVAGAGPAGLTASRELRRAGARVMLVDARARIGHPVRCGEMTRPQLFRELRIEPRPEWVRWTLRHGGSGVPVLNRPRLEEDLATELAGRGVMVRAGTTVLGVGPYDGRGRTVTLQRGREREQVRAGLVVAADGIASLVARSAGIDTRLGLEQTSSCITQRWVDVDLATVDRHTFMWDPILSPGYFWIIPCGEREANVGLGVAGRRGYLCRSLLERMLATSRLMKGGRVVETMAGAVPAVAPLERPYADGLMLVGAAARMVDAHLGEGIFYAVVSGRLAAETFVELRGAAPVVSALVPYRAKLEQLYHQLYRQLEVRQAAARRGLGRRRRPQRRERGHGGIRP